MKGYWKIFFVTCIGLIIAGVSCTGTPVITRPIQTAGNAKTLSGMAIPTEKQTPTTTETITETVTITPTPTKVPDVELAQLQLVHSEFIAEIVNHLDVPVVFEDQKPAFRFDVYDPVLDRHFLGEETIDRYNDITASVPCVIYPGETAFFYGGSQAYHKWFIIGGNTTDKPLLTFTYQSLGVPRPDWKENGTHYEIRDLTWRIDSNLLYFSFRHDPLKRVYGGHEFFVGSMGLYDKDNLLLGVAYGWPLLSIDTGIADDFWIGLDNKAAGGSGKGWIMESVDNIKERLDHIKVMLEVLPGYDEVCHKRLPTPTA